MRLQAPPEALLDQVNLAEAAGIGVEDLMFVPQLGFLAIQGEQGRFQVVGFHADAQSRARITPVIQLDERPEDKRNLNDNAKGVGIILGNAATAIYHPERQKRCVGVWATPELDPESITDFHHADPENLVTMLAGIARHAGLMALARAPGVGDEGALRHVESRYGDSSLAVIDPAPKWLLAQRGAGVRHAIPPVWAVYRDRMRRPLEYVGFARR